MKMTTWTLEPQRRPLWERLRQIAAPGLRRTGVQLAVLARHWQCSPTLRSTDSPVLEFYAEAGAPEGALFVDGQRVGVLDGVRRL